jgi:hypothetical protein
MNVIKRNCPKCNKIITYCNKYVYNKAIENNSSCKSCSQIGREFSIIHRNNLGKSKLNKKILFSEEHKKNISKGKTGVLFTDEHKHNLSESRKNKPMLDVTKEALIKSRKNKNNTKEHNEKIRQGNINFNLNSERKRTTKCKIFIINGIICEGTCEKKYIENLILSKSELPWKPSRIKTPFGTYKPDFEFQNRYVEIKSTYTYKIYLGELKGYGNKYSTLQKQKLEWVNNNIKKVELKIIK